jgi:hypothetical protein
MFVQPTLPTSYTHNGDDTYKKKTSDSVEFWEPLCKNKFYGWIVGKLKLSIAVRNCAWFHNSNIYCMLQ